MKKAMCVVSVLFIYISSQYITCAQDSNIGNATLQKALKSMTPTLHDYALSATFVRTTYIPQALDIPFDTQEPKIKRTTISEISVNSDGVKESVCDSRKVMDSVRQYAFHYSDWEDRRVIYDSKNERGTVRKKTGPPINHLLRVLSPDVGARDNRFVSRAMPVLPAKFDRALVTSENLSEPEGKCIILEGEYNNSDPARYFRATINPAYNHAVVKLEEYDKNKRMLTDINMGNYIELSTGPVKLWIPKQTTVKRYRYDDHEGNTLQFSKLDILEPKIVPADKTTFSLFYPYDAEVYDTTIDLGLGKLRKEIGEIALDTIKDAPLTQLLTDKKGETIVSRTQRLYEKETACEPVASESISKKETPEQIQSLQSRTLRMPEPDVKPILIKILQILFISAIVCIFVYIVYRRKTATSNETSERG